MTRSSMTLLIALLALGACASDTRLADGLVGQSEAQLLARLGPPAATGRDGATEWLRYERKEVATLPPEDPRPEDSPFAGGGGPPILPGSLDPPQTVVTGVCTTEYRVVEGRVVSWRQSGRYC